MKKAVFIFLSTLLVALLPREAAAANRDVCGTCTYTDISSAIAAAASGDTVRVSGGTYSTYLNDISVNSANATISILGGYNSTFTSRNSETILSGVGIQFGPSFSGSATLDGLTITGQSGSSAVYFASSYGNFTVNNCHIYGNAQAITLWPYYPDSYQDISATFTITNNVIHDHSTAQGAITLSLSSTDAYATNVNISGNVIYDTAGAYASGIYMSYNANYGNISIQQNEIYGNQLGTQLTLNGSSMLVDISNNDVHDNRSHGILVYGAPSIDGNMTVHHNRVYRNTTWGIYQTNPQGSSYYNNVVADESRGIQLISATGHPSVRNNIFYRISYTGFYMTSNESGFGGTAMLPSALRYNDFYNPPGTPGTGKYTNSGLYPAYTFYSEDVTDFNAMNQFAWSTANFKEDPRFVDPDNGDFHLRNDSFLIDEGDPSDSAASEPAPNGSRANLGAYGRTSAAETTGSAVVASSLTGAQSGNNVVAGFDTTTSVNSTWLTLEYWDGAAYQTIPQTALSGTGYNIGYLTGRMATGSARSLIWSGASSLFQNAERNDIKLRLTASHGNDSSVVVSPNFIVDYKAPTVQMVRPAPTGGYVDRTGWTLVASASDGGSGISSVKFKYRPDGSSSFIDINGTATSAPYVVAWNGASLTPGSTCVVRAVATDNFGNTSTSDSTATVCSQTATPSSGAYSAAAQDGSYSVTTPFDECSWSVIPDSDWITITGGASPGFSSTVSFSISANTGPARSGKITTGSATYTVFQAGVENCQYTATGPSREMAAAGDSGTINITASSPTCIWQIANDATWVSLSRSSGTGSGTVNFTVAPNTLVSGRLASLSVSGQHVGIGQAPVVKPPRGMVPSADGLDMTAKQKQKKITIQNTTTQKRSITGASFSSAGVFKVSLPKFPLVLKPGKSKTFTVSFKTKTPGTYVGSITFTTNDPGADPIVVPLTGIK